MKEQLMIFTVTNKSTLRADGLSCDRAHTTRIYNTQKLQQNKTNYYVLIIMY